MYLVVVIEADLLSGSIKGAEVDVVDILAKKHNFDYHLKLEPTWGKKLSGIVFLRKKFKENTVVTNYFRNSGSNAWVGIVGSVSKREMFTIEKK